MEPAEELRRAVGLRPSIDGSQERAGEHGRLLATSQDLAALLNGIPAGGTVPQELPVQIGGHGCFLDHNLAVLTSVGSGSLGNEQITREPGGGYLLQQQDAAALDTGNPARLEYPPQDRYPMGSGYLDQQIILVEPAGSAQVDGDLTAGQPAILTFPTHGSFVSLLSQVANPLNYAVGRDAAPAQLGEVCPDSEEVTVSIDPEDAVFSTGGADLSDGADKSASEEVLFLGSDSSALNCSDDMEALNEVSEGSDENFMSNSGTDADEDVPQVFASTILGDCGCVSGDFLCEDHITCLIANSKRQNGWIFRGLAQIQNSEAIVYGVHWSLLVEIGVVSEAFNI